MVRIIKFSRQAKTKCFIPFGPQTHLLQKNTILVRFRVFRISKKLSWLLKASLNCCNAYPTMAGGNTKSLVFLHYVIFNVSLWLETCYDWYNIWYQSIYIASALLFFVLCLLLEITDCYILNFISIFRIFWQ